MTKKLIAIASDGNIDGDSIFNVFDFQIDYKKGMTIKDVRKKVSQIKKLTDTGLDEEMINDIVIAYVIDRNTFADRLNSATEELELEIQERDHVSDSDDYDLNEAEREYLKDNALFTIE